MTDAKRISRLRLWPTGPAVSPKPWESRGHAVPRAWWVWPLVIYAGNRIINTVMILIASHSQIGLSDHLSALSFRTLAGQAASGYGSVATNWDGQWYWEVATNGYPDELPRTQDGSVEVNPWAFFPLYPMTVRAITAAFGLSFPVVAVLVSLIAGAIAMLLLYRLVASRYGHMGGCLSVLALSTFICSPVLQIAYSEGMALALVLATLLGIATRHYWWAAGTLLLLGFTRGIAVAFTMALVLYGVHLWRRSQLSRSHAISISLLAIWAMLCGIAWPVVAGMVTGEPQAYLLTQQAWRPEVTTIPIVRFVDQLTEGPGSRIAAFVIALAWVGLLLRIFTKSSDEPIVKFWAVAYILYLLTVIDWKWTSMRYYLLALPVLWPLIKINNSHHKRRYLVMASALAGIGIVTQWLWIRYAVVISDQSILFP